MLPPVLEIFVVWHPDDVLGQAIADEVVTHYHGTSFTGLIGGAVEVYVRSESCGATGGVPREIFTPSSPPPNGVAPAMFTAIVPLLGQGLAAVAQSDRSWNNYLCGIVAAQRRDPRRVAILPYRLTVQATNNTALGHILGAYQAIAANVPDKDDSPKDARCRDLSQALAQFVSGDVSAQILAFISHTKHSSKSEIANVQALIDSVQSAIASTHMKDFFDARDLQPGTDWAGALTAQAERSAFIALRTDLYASREWCQREVLIAKRNGMPIVILDALGYAEERGSFLMDHVPRTPIRADGLGWSRRDVYRSLNLLVDECLKRALWKRQKDLAQNRSRVAVSWWAPHAPEPITLVNWLEANAKKVDKAGLLRILHPDPPLGPDEKLVLEQILRLRRKAASLDVMTPRQLASRGG